MEEGFVSDIYKRFIKVTNLNPLLIYDMTVLELTTLFEVYDTKVKEELETKANIIRLAVNSAMSGKPLKLFEDTKPRVNKSTKEQREEEFKALDDLGI